MSTLQIIGALIGGLGLFLLAVGMMSEGLRDAAGNSLRKLLSHWTCTPLRGVFSGLFMTAVVQSSSAVTVAAIGFVNAGLLNLRQTLGVIYGANIGTTMTGWLVALVGFKLNIQAFALPLIGIGMLLRLFSKQGRWPAFGLALVGFGLFFIGVDVLKGAFEGMVATFNLAEMTAEGGGQLFWYLITGIVVTVLTQSSSAAIALTITAAAAGVIGIHAAAAMVVGANVGTTSTAVLAAIGATVNAKRVALAQVLFNVGTGLVALMILPLMFWVVRLISEVAGLAADPGITLALFHTIFNVLGVLLVLPLNERLASFLEGCFLRREEKVHLPKFLDSAVATTPVLAINALILELEALAQRVHIMLQKALGKPGTDAATLHEELRIVRELSRAISVFIVKLSGRALPQEVSQQLATLLRVDQYLVSCAVNIEIGMKKGHQVDDATLLEKQLGLSDYQAELLSALTAQEPEELQQGLSKVQGLHDHLKTKALQAGAEGRLDFEPLMQLLEILAEQLRLAQQWLKAGHYLNRLKRHISANGDQHDVDPFATPNHHQTLDQH